MSLRDRISTEIDRRMIKRLVKNGVVDASDLADAPIIRMVPDCSCGQGLDFKSDPLACPKCGTEAKKANQ